MSDGKTAQVYGIRAYKGAVAAFGDRAWHQGLSACILMQGLAVGKVTDMNFS
jgi:hypothetical protein